MTNKRSTPGNYVIYIYRTQLEISTGTNKVEDQRKTIHNYLQTIAPEGTEPKIIKEFVEIETPSDNDRLELTGQGGAIIHSWLTASSLVVVCMDRLPHDVYFVSLMLTEIYLVTCDLPYTCHQPSYNLTVMMAVNHLENKTSEKKEERRLLVARIKDLLHIETFR